MKAIKLFGIFIGLLIAVVGVVLIVDKIIRDETETVVGIGDTTLESYTVEVRSDWEKKDDWDQAMFDRHQSDIKVLSADYETKSLKDLDRQEAVNVVNKKIFTEWKSPSCRKDVIDKYANAVKYVKSKDSDAATDPNVRTIEAVYKSYQSAYNFAHQSFGLTPSFDGSSWNSFDSYRDQQLNKKNSIVNDPNYKKYLSGITDIKNGLNAVDSKLTTARNAFYNSLAQEIINYYSNMDRTVNNLKSLNRVRDIFDQQYSSKTNLDNFVSMFAEQVN